MWKCLDLLIVVFFKFLACSFTMSESKSIHMQIGLTIRSINTLQYAWHKQALCCCSWQQKYLDFILFFLLLLLYPEKVFNADPLLTLFVQNSDKFLTYKGHIPLGRKDNNTFWITLYYVLGCLLKHNDQPDKDPR